jgi:hypothetical protein
MTQAQINKNMDIHNLIGFYTSQQSLKSQWIYDQYNTTLKQTKKNVGMEQSTRTRTSTLLKL